MKLYFLIESVRMPGSFYDGRSSFRGFIFAAKFNTTKELLAELREACKLQPCKITEYYEED